MDAEQEEAEVAAITAAFRAAGAQADVRVVPPEQMQDEVRACWDAPERPRAVVVAGGDGTVSCAAGAAAGTDIVLGALPLGTFNHFAKDIALSDELGAAVAELVGGDVRSIDAAEVNGRVFVNNSVLGLYPDLVAVRDRIRDQRGWGKVRAVPVALVDVLRRFPMHRLDLRGPAYERRHVRTPLVFVGNGVFGNEDGGAPTRDDLADGFLGVAVSRAKSRWGLVRSALRALVRGAEDVDDIDTVALTELTVDVHVRHVRVAVDGEICWMESPLRYRIRPGALQVLVPPAFDPPADAPAT
ncbi:diacylglycerol/lipid kinase family protein [Aquihabitans daechungensis]|uniref:diacylglycerol/lipid kinase family protein n=1 Tax=Aquihabitans daechungensis TaxID=1052257 RepID=UPI003BA1F301